MGGWAIPCVCPSSATVILPSLDSGYHCLPLCYHWGYLMEALRFSSLLLHPIQRSSAIPGLTPQVLLPAVPRRATPSRPAHAARRLPRRHEGLPAAPPGARVAAVAAAAAHGGLCGGHRGARAGRNCTQGGRGQEAKTIFLLCY